MEKYENGFSGNEKSLAIFVWAPRVPKWYY